MAQQPLDLEAINPDELLGEAVEDYLALLEQAQPPDFEEFVARYPEPIRTDLREALEGLSLVQGLVGSGGVGPGGRRLQAGRRLAGYRIVGELGSGGMGVVYEAVHVDLDRPVALKVLDARAMRPGSSGLQRFLNEAKTAASLHHTNIVPVFDVGHVGGLCYYAMQRIEGSGLDRVLRTLRLDRSLAAGSGSGRSPLRARNSGQTLEPTGLTTAWPPAPTSNPQATPSADLLNSDTDDDTPTPYAPPKGNAYFRWVADVGRQTAQALSYAHHRGIIHRDIKPSNLLIDARGAIWVADFGLARRIADPGMTQVESLVGTPRYMSPEQARSDSLDPRTDVYSLGATLYELLTLKPPFEGRSTAELIEQVAQRDPIAPRKHDPRIPRDLETIVLKALSKRPADRYASAADFAQDLERFLQFEPVRARRIGPAGRLWRLAKRHPSLTAVTAVATAVVLAVASFAYVRVVMERDRAVLAEATMEDVFREHLLGQATLVRNSAVPDRRLRGMELLQDAVKLSPTPIQYARLRNEAVAYLSMRDVERQADWATGSRTLGLVFHPGGNRMAAVSEDGREVLFWSQSLNQNDNRKPLPTGPGPAPEPEPDPPPSPERKDGSSESRKASGPGPGPGFPFGGLWGPRLGAAGTQAATLWPSGAGYRLFDLDNPAPETIVDRPTPGHSLLTLQALNTPDGIRLLTLERAADDPRDPFSPSRGILANDDEADPATRDRSRDRDRFRFAFRALLWNPASPELPPVTLIEPGPDDPDPAFPLLAHSPDGKLIASAWARGSVVSFFSSQDGKPLFQIETHSAIGSLALGPQNMMAVAGSGVVRIWDHSTQTPLPSVTPYKSYIRQVEFSPDGRLLAIAGTGTDIELWDPAANELVASLPTPERVSSIAFAPTGDLLAIGQPEALNFWKVVEPEIRSRASGFEATPSSLAFGPDGSLALAFRGEITARLWHDTRVPCTIPILEGLLPSALSYDNQGRLIALTDDQLLWFDTTNPGAAPVRQVQINAGPPRLFQFLAQASDGKSLIINRPGQVLSWSPTYPDHLTPLNLIIEGDRPPGPGPGGEGDRPPRPGGEGDRMKKASGGRPRGGSSRNRQPPLLNFAVGPGAERIYVSSWNGQLIALAVDQVSRSARQLSWNVPVQNVTSLALSRDGVTLAVGNRESALALVDTATGQLRTWLDLPPASTSESGVSALAFSRDGRSLAVGFRSGEVLLWNLGDPAQPAAALSLPSHRGAVLDLAFDPEGRHLATTGEDKTLTVWHLDTLQAELARLGLP